jgi:hypothetical protein
MKQAMISLAQPGAARNIADLVLKLAERTEKK